MLGGSWAWAPRSGNTPAKLNGGELLVPGCSKQARVRVPSLKGAAWMMEKNWETEA